MEPGQYSPDEMVPVELIELQPSYGQGGAGAGELHEFAPNWLETQGTAKSRFVLERLRDVPKAIVFSQFQEHLRMMEDCLPDGRYVGPSLSINPSVYPSPSLSLPLPAPSQPLSLSIAESLILLFSLSPPISPSFASSHPPSFSF